MPTITEVENLKNATIYGYSLISDVEINSRSRVRKLVLFLMMGATQSYVEAIVKLISPPNIYDKAAEVLFRSLIENLINLNYIYTGRSEINAITFMLFSTQEQIDYARNCVTTLQKFPHWNLDLGSVVGISGWQNFLRQKQSEYNSITQTVQNKRHCRISKMPKLNRRAEIADNLTNKKLLKQKTSNYNYDIQFYKYFSQSAHLTMPGLEQFFDKSKSTARIDGESGDAVRVAVVTHAIYITILRFFAKKFDIFKNDEFNKIRIEY